MIPTAGIVGGTAGLVTDPFSVSAVMTTADFVQAFSAAFDEAGKDSLIPCVNVRVRSIEEPEPDSGSPVLAGVTIGVVLVVAAIAGIIYLMRD